MKKMISAFLAVAVTVGTFATAMPVAKADNGRIAAGVAGGLIGGALLGGAIAAQGRPAYGYGYAEPAPTYYAPSCRYVEREPVWDGYGWRQRRPIRVCD